jgi:hypothetical protein
MESIPKCQFVLFITFLGEKLLSQTVHSFYLYDLFVQDVEPFVSFIKPCLVCSLELTVRRPFIPPMGSPRVPGIIGLPK